MQTNDLSGKTPIVADEVRAPGVNAVSEMKRGAAGRTGTGNVKSALGIEIEKINPQNRKPNPKNLQQNKPQNKPQKNTFFSRPEVSTRMADNFSHNLLN